MDSHRISAQRRQRNRVAPTRINHSDQSHGCDGHVAASNGHYRREQEPAFEAIPGCKAKEAQQLVSHDLYVENWLAQITDSETQPYSKVRRADKGISYQRPDIQKFQDLSSPLDFTIDRRIEIPSKRRHEIAPNSSPGSSFLEPGLLVVDEDRDNQLEYGFHSAASNPKHGDTYKRRKRDQSCDILSSHPSPAIIHAPKETFERRRRHKTREDRYDPKPPKTNIHIGCPPRIRLKREKRGDRRKAVKITGEDLIGDFSSKSTSNTRLTLKPNHGPGLFKNGRASSPSRWRALPDLAFSEMEFLRRSKQHAIDQDENKRFKSKKKDHRKTQRVQDEIDSYFKPAKQPLCEEDVNSKDRNGQESAFRFDEVSTSFRHRSSYSVSTPHSVDFSKSYLGFGSRGPTPAKVTNNRSRLLVPTSAEIKIDTKAGRSDRSTTFYTWSESVQSLPMDDSLAQTHNQDQRMMSLTPESIRIKLHETGIFEGTAISKGLVAQQRETATDGYCNPRRTESPVQQPGRGEIPAVSVQNQPVQERAGSERNPTSPQDVQGEVEKNLSKPSSNTKVIPHALSQAPLAEFRIPASVTKHSDPNSEWRKEPDKGPEGREGITSVTNSRPISRLALAQNVYVKTPITARPDSRPEVRQYRRASRKGVSTPEALHQDEQNDPNNPTTVSEQRLRLPSEPLFPQLNSTRKDEQEVTDESNLDRPPSSNALFTDPSRMSPRNVIESCHHTDLQPEEESSMAVGSISNDVYGHQNYLEVSGVTVSRPISVGKDTKEYHPADFYRLPTRGIWSNTMGQQVQPPTILTSAILVEPLYRHQLKNQLPVKFGNLQHGRDNDLYFDPHNEDMSHAIDIYESALLSHSLDDGYPEYITGMHYQDDIDTENDQAQWLQNSRDQEFGHSMIYDPGEYKSDKMKQVRSTSSNRYGSQIASYQNQDRPLARNCQTNMEYEPPLLVDGRGGIDIVENIPLSEFWKSAKQY